MKQSIIISIIGIISIFGIIVALSLGAPHVSGANNDTLYAKVNITNTEPNLYSVTINPTTIDLTPGNTTLINCTGLIYDANGWDDIANVNATLYHNNYGDGTTTDNNYRYQNISCESTCNQYEGSATNASCSCNFELEYYAYNGSWQCNMTIGDAYGLPSTANSSLSTINTVIGIGVPDEIDYGDMSVAETSSKIEVNVTNFGNVPINVSLRGWGGTNETYPGATNYTMLCGINNITYGYHRYSTNSTETFANMFNITNTSTGIPNFDLPSRENDNNYGNDSNSTYWQLEIPTNVGGFCNGTIQFYATQTN